MRDRRGAGALRREGGLSDQRVRRICKARPLRDVRSASARGDLGLIRHGVSKWTLPLPYLSSMSRRPSGTLSSNTSMLSALPMSTWRRTATPRSSRCAATQYGLLISDWEMPNMGGEELLKAVRQDPKGHKLPIIMITAKTSRGSSWLAGANVYLAKPFTDADFEKAVKTALGLSLIALTPRSSRRRARAPSRSSATTRRKRETQSRR